MRSVRKPALKRLALQACSERNELFGETETPEQSLARRMNELRAHYAPFLKRHAPAFPATRERLPLTSFDWRVNHGGGPLDFLGSLRAGAVGRWTCHTTRPMAGGDGLPDILCVSCNRRWKGGVSAL